MNLILFKSVENCMRGLVAGAACGYPVLPSLWLSAVSGGDQRVVTRHQANTRQTQYSIRTT
jgi:hypothetical protein